MERPGCKWIASLLSLGMAAGFLFGGSQCSQMFGGGQDSNQNQQNLGQELARIGDFKIYEKVVQNLAQTPQQGQGLDPLTSKPEDYSTAYANALDAEVTHCLLLAEAKDNGYPLDDKAILDAIGSQFDESLPQQKMMAEVQQKIPQNATDKDFDDYVKKLSGHSVAEQRQTRLDSYQKGLSDPLVRDALLRQFANDIVVNGIEKSITVTDDDLKHSQDQYVSKEIVFKPAKHPGVNLEKEANQVLADLKAKKITFEDAMDKYSDEAPGKGKKLHDNTSETDTMTWKTNPDYAPVRDLKQGQISEVYPDKPDGYKISELVSIISPPMPDFDKRKDDLKRNYLQTLSAEQLQEGLKKERNKNIIKWDVPGWGLLEDWQQATLGQNSTFTTKSPAEQNKINQSFLDKAAKVTDSGGELTAVGALMPLWNSAKGSAKDALTDQFMSVMSDFLSQYPSFSGRMALVAVAADKKNGKLLDQSLLAACDINDAGVSNSSGEANFTDIAAALDKYQSTGLLKTDEAKAIQMKLDSWRDEKLQSDIEQAKEAKEEAIEKKKVMAERLQAEANKPKPPAPKPLIGSGVRALPQSGPGAPTGSPIPGMSPMATAPKASTPAPAKPAATPAPPPAKPAGK
jgi:hypothetical protein